MKVLICVDSGHAAEIVLTEAKKMLMLLPNADVYVFSVVDLFVILVAQGSDDYMAKKLEEDVKDVKTKAITILGDKINFASGTGYPEEKILEYSNELNCDLLILGTHGRTGLEHAVIGSVAERVLRRITCNTLVIPVRSRMQKNY
jgi:nucleotide-binding universal stress UspA family protein